MIDDDDFDLVKNFKWHTIKPRQNRSHYVMTRGRKGTKPVYMHRLILSARPNEIVDHVNGDGLDNQRANLRICTKREDQYNRPGWFKRKGYKGVWKIKKVTGRNGGKPWEAKISIDGKQVYLGSFTTPGEAARRYDKYAKHFHGEFAYLNFRKIDPINSPDPVLDRIMKALRWRE
jgi:hypothetical protein